MPVAAGSERWQQEQTHPGRLVGHAVEVEVFRRRNSQQNRGLDGLKDRTDTRALRNILVDSTPSAATPYGARQKASP
jgi:hypothetical protein